MRHAVYNPAAGIRGAALLEFALVLLPLILLVFGIIEFGLLLFNKQVLTNAAREGARAGIVNVIGGARLACSDPDPAAMTIESIAEDYCASHLVTFSSTPSPPAISCELNGTSFTASPSADFQDDLRVGITYQYDFLLLPNFITSLAGGTNLSAVSVMKYE